MPRTAKPAKPATKQAAATPAKKPAPKPIARTGANPIRPKSEPAPAAAEPVRIDTGLIEDYLRQQARRREVQREVDALEREEKRIKEAMLQHVRSLGKKVRETRVGRYTLRLVDFPGTVRWKDELIRVAGEDEAKRLQKECPPRVSIEVS